MINRGPSSQAIGPERGWRDYGMIGGNIGTDVAAMYGLGYLGSHTAPVWAPAIRGWMGETKGVGARALKSLMGKELGTATGKEAVQFFGKKLPGGLAKAAGFAGAPAQFISGFLALQFASAVPMVAAGGFEAFAAVGAQARRERKIPSYTGNLEMYGRGFRDSQMAATMRQSAMAQIQQSQFGVRSALSREAYMMHR